MSAQYLSRDCFVIRRRHTGALYSVRKHGCTQSVIMFTDENRARGFLKLIKQMDAPETLKQPLEISTARVDILASCMNVVVIDY